MAAMGTQGRHDADNWTGYESGWIAGKTWQEPSKGGRISSRMSRVEAAGHRMLAVTLAPLLVVIVAALAAGWL